MTDVQKILIDQFLSIYGEPRHTSDLESYFDTWEVAMQGWSEDILKSAVAAVIRDWDSTYSKTTWPAPGVVTAACRRISPPTRIVDTQYSAGWRDPPTDEEREAWDGRMRKFREIMEQASDHLLRRTARNVPPTDKAAFREMQRRNQNPLLHVKSGSLTDLSRRMIGERE